MKTILMTLIILIPYLCLGQNKTCNDIRGKDCCGGTGLCSNVGIQVNDSENKTPNPNSIIKLILPESYFDKEQVDRIKNENENFYFPIEEDIILGDDIITKFNLNSDLNTIKSGNYIVFYDQEKYYLEVNLKISK
jgi:hypothetical protein